MCLSGNISERKSAFSGCEQCLVPEGDLSRWSLRRLKSHNDFNGMFPDRHLLTTLPQTFERHVAPPRRTIVLEEERPMIAGLRIFGRALTARPELAGGDRIA